MKFSAVFHDNTIEGDITTLDAILRAGFKTLGPKLNITPLSVDMRPHLAKFSEIALSRDYVRTLKILAGGEIRGQKPGPGFYSEISTTGICKSPADAVEKTVLIHVGINVKGEHSGSFSWRNEQQEAADGMGKWIVETLQKAYQYIAFSSAIELRKDASRSINLFCIRPEIVGAPPNLERVFSEAALSYASSLMRQLRQNDILIRENVTGTRYSRGVYRQQLDCAAIIVNVVTGRKLDDSYTDIMLVDLFKRGLSSLRLVEIKRPADRRDIGIHHRKDPNDRTYYCDKYFEIEEAKST